jgi:hypothetical protein
MRFILQRTSWVGELRAAFLAPRRLKRNKRRRLRASGRCASFEALEERAMLAVVGDYNGGGIVDASDYVLWRKTLNTPVVIAHYGADGNGNGMVDADDYSVWRSNFGKYLDDFGNNAPTANQISSLPSTQHGLIEVPGDVDWFAFTATAGTTYDLSTTLGTLSDSVLRLVGTDGVTQLAQNDNAVGLASLIHWTAPANGTYYAEVRGAASLTGSYDLKIETSVATPPVISSNGGSATAFVNVVEGHAGVTTVQASGNAPITYSITGGADRTRFSLNSSSGVLTFIQTPNYDAPTDANADEDYVLEVTATNAFGSDVQIITIAVKNDATNDSITTPPSQALLNAFTNYGTIGSAHFGMMTYVPLSVTPWEVTQGADTAVFDPGPNFSWLDYLTKMKNIGCKAVLLTTKHVDGFCLWPSAASDFCVANTEWFANNGQINVLKEFCDTARSLGMDVGFYFSMWDDYIQRQVGGTYNGAYRTAIYGELHELMTEFGDVKFIFLDAWGPFWGQFNGPTYDDMPYATVYNYIKSLQPNCLVGVNDHEWASGDFRIFEGPIDGEPPAGLTAKPVFLHQPIQATNKWFSHIDSVVEDVADDVSVNSQLRDRIHQKGYVWSPNISPGPDGKLSSDLSAILLGLAVPPGSGAELESSSFTLPQLTAAGMASDADYGAPVASAPANESEHSIGTLAVNIDSDAASLAWAPSPSGRAAHASELGDSASTIYTHPERASAMAFRFESALDARDDNSFLAGAWSFADRNLLRTTSTDDDEEHVPVGLIDSYFESFKDCKWEAVSNI